MRPACFPDPPGRPQPGREYLSSGGLQHRRQWPRRVGQRGGVHRNASLDQAARSGEIALHVDAHRISEHGPDQLEAAPARLRATVSGMQPPRF